MKRLTKGMSLALALALCLTLCGCGQSAKSSAAREAAPMSAPAAYNGSAAYDAAWEAPAEMEMAGESGFGVSAGGSAAEESAPEADPEKIIYSARVTLESTAFAEAIAQVEALTREVGGWIESSSINGANFNDSSRGYSRNRSASYTLRIPSARFEQVMSTLPQFGNVPYSHRYSENVTAQYYDVQAHMNAYKTQEARLLELMELAQTVEDVIALEARLSELRYQIESLQATLNNWDRRVSYSTINLELNEVKVYTPEPEKRVSYGEELWGALKDGVKSTVEFLKDLLVFLAELLPTLVVLVPAIWLIVRLIRKLRQRRKAKKAAKAAQPDQRRAPLWKKKAAQPAAEPESLEAAPAAGTEKADASGDSKPEA